MEGRDWYDWHGRYGEPASGLAQRLALVQDRIRVALDEAPPGPVRVISLCAGQGRDLLGVLPGHPRRDVIARLVELDPRNTAAAKRAAAEAGLRTVEIVTGDASLTSQYADLAPASLVIMSGLFGNLNSSDVERTVGYCTQLCATGGTVVWTRGRRWARSAHDPVPQICEWFEDRGFDRLWLSDPRHKHGVGAHRFTRTPLPLDQDASMFTFADWEVLTAPAVTTMAAVTLDTPSGRRRSVQGA